MSKPYFVVHKIIIRRQICTQEPCVVHTMNIFEACWNLAKLETLEKLIEAAGAFLWVKDNNLTKCYQKPADGKMIIALRRVLLPLLGTEITLHWEQGTNSQIGRTAFHSSWFLFFFTGLYLRLISWNSWKRKDYKTQPRLFHVHSNICTLAKKGQDISKSY